MATIPTILDCYSGEPINVGEAVREMKKLIAKADKCPELAYVPPKQKPLTAQQQRERAERLKRILA